jgi:hypothetical protein
MAKKSRTTPANAATPTPETGGAGVDYQATVFNVPVVRDSDDKTSVLAIPLAPGGGDEATAMLSILQPSSDLFGTTEPELAEPRSAAASGPPDNENGPTLRVKMVATDARPERPAPRFSAAPGAPA